MWIIPSTHPLYSAFAQEVVDSKEDLNELLQNYGEIKIKKVSKEEPLKETTTTVSGLPLLWKSDLLNAKTWYRQWKGVFWLQRLFGRTLKPFRHKDFETRYTESLEVIHANHSLKQDNEKEKKTQDTFGRLYENTFAQSDLFGASLKMSKGISRWDSLRFIKTSVWA